MVFIDQTSKQCAAYILIRENVMLLVLNNVLPTTSMRVFKSEETRSFVYLFNMDLLFSGSN